MVGMIAKCFSTLRGQAFASYSTQSCQRSGGGHEARSRTVICSPLGAMCWCKGISVMFLLQLDLSQLSPMSRLYHLYRLYHSCQVDAYSTCSNLETVAGEAA